jgi:hypothetical protein
VKVANCHLYRDAIYLFISRDDTSLVGAVSGQEVGHAAYRLVRHCSCIVFVDSAILLLNTELRNRARRHVKGCPSLSYISPERLNSLIIIEPDLEILELGPTCGNAGIPDAHQVPVDQLEGFVSHKSRSTIFVFYDSVKERVNWGDVELLVRKYLLRYVFVLKGGLEEWQSHQYGNHQADIGSSTHTAKLA